MSATLEIIEQPGVDRREFIGGSDIAAILGISPWETAVDLWLDKTTPPAGPQSGNVKAKRRGKRLEPYIIDMIREEHGLEIVARNVRHVDPDVPYFAAEVDAEALIVPESDDARLRENIEIKTVHPFKSRDWGERETDQLPLHYIAQAQWGLGITGRRVCRVFALIGDDLRPYVVERDDLTISAMRERAAEFWTRYVLAKARPPFDFSHSAVLETMRRLYPGTDGSTIKATAMHEHWRAVMQTAEELRDRYQGVIDGAKAHILGEMGSAALLSFADGKSYRRKEVSVKACTIEKPAGKYIDFRLVKTPTESPE